MRQCCGGRPSPDFANGHDVNAENLLANLEGDELLHDVILRI
jgi:hypothetical protein